MTPIKLLLVDDHVMFREGLARALEKQRDFVLVGQAGSSAEAIRVLETTPIDIVLLDVDLGPERALDFMRAARRAGFNGQILVVTAGLSDHEAVQLVQSGVSGILHKTNSTEILFQTIRQVASGEVTLEKAYLGPLFRSVDRSQPQGKPKLTERDKTVLRFVLQGLTNRQIAAKLDISEGAVKASLRHVCDKLDVRTRAQLVRVALEQYRDQL
jgi:two-component system nitrate/nitrite response regulator NarL